MPDNNSSTLKVIEHIINLTILLESFKLYTSRIVGIFQLIKNNIEDSGKMTFKVFEGCKILTVISCIIPLISLAVFKDKEVVNVV